MSEELDWGAVLKAARLHPDMDKEVMFDDVGALVTCGRPMIESMICDRQAGSHRLRFYLQMLGFVKSKGRILKVGIGTKIKTKLSGKQKKVKRAR